MEDKIREYEKFIKEKTSEKLGPIERVKLAEYHKEMVANFQHERLIHLIVTHLFAMITIVTLVGMLYFQTIAMLVLFVLEMCLVFPYIMLISPLAKILSAHGCELRSS